MTTLAAAAGTIGLGEDLVVNRLGFGAMRLTGEGVWGPPDDREAAHRVLRRAVGLGVNCIDTADAYGPGISEELIAEALAPYPPDLVIATKGGLVRPGPGRWHADGRPEHLRAACEASLRRLRLDQIALYQLHTPDPAVPLEESVGALAELRAEGKVRHVGISNVTVAQAETAAAVVPVVSVQNRYSLADRASEDVLDWCQRRGAAFIPWFPLAAGDLAKPGGVLEEVAAAHGATNAQVALAWLLAHSPALLPIPGTASLAHLEENVAAAGIRLTPQDMDRLEAA
jgi:aryl-alcohol dehydrogenase-like predicted oxidoreductase